MLQLFSLQLLLASSNVPFLNRHFITCHLSDSTVSEDALKLPAQFSVDWEGEEGGLRCRNGTDHRMQKTASKTEGYFT